ncbi:GNAT family acetyltransferase [Mangrovibacter phragmitis]|uniref:GNAT family acetyltransferase n=1 Tax=Mangrovibacter phragmitis TaxID=1691903 RepID=A0A1B7L836_9ENTR|nr:GNAT family N-acetyltransferase [Mangrovibacter phragmitis]OAT78488.1 GNAT family acetyltransferase [Mangrovibacter phragmitis]
MRIAHYDTPEELARCYTLMCELRCKLKSKAQFISQVQRQQKQGYRLSGMEQNGKPVALAGYRLLENFIHGRFCYVDDLVTARTARRQGFGADLLNNLAVVAREYGCSRMVLDTAVSNTQAQAFYQFSSYSACGLHFYRELN